MIRVTVVGGAGRMGGSVAEQVFRARDMELAGIVEREDNPNVGAELFGVLVTSELRPLIIESNVIVEFTSPQGLVDILNQLEGSTVPLISGTTGLSDAELEAIKEEGKNRPVLWSPNMSVGVNLLFKMAGDAAKALPDYDVEIVEMHHRHKKDAPSGTAKKLADIVREVRSISKIIYGREGRIGKRKPDEMAVLSLRCGDVAGEHTVYFATEGERVELTHRASSRLAFAQGTLRAIRFIVHKPKGFYQFADILEDK